MIPIHRAAVLFISLSLLSPPLPGEDLHVPGDFAAIQEAVDHAVSGDRILVAPGTYFENIAWSDKSIDLLGENRETTVIDGGGKRSTIRFERSDRVTLSGFTVRNAQGYGDFAGILQIESDQSVLSGNLFQRNGVGIHLEDSHQSSIADNLFEGNLWNSVLLQGSTENRIENNEIPKGGFGPALWLVYASVRNTVSGNTLTNRYDHGISLEFASHENTIADNRIDDCDIGINIHTAHNLVTGNIITKCKSGMELVDAYDCLVADNTLEENLGHGIRVDSSDDLVIRGNRLANQGIGIRFYGVVNCAVEGNRITNHGDYGIDIMNSQDNGFWDNTVADNDLGLFLSQHATRNRIYHNGFTGNSTDARDEVNGNFWDDGYPSGGNYWSAYPGEDLDGDGLGDTPLSIEGLGNGSDGYPLISPHGHGLLWADGYTASTRKPGTVAFSLDASKINAHRQYLVLGSLTGTDPGIPLPGGLVELPLTWDLFTDLIWQHVNTPAFLDFLGTLDASGSAAALFSYQNPIPAQFNGRTFYFAYCLAEPGPYDYVSTALSVEVID